MREGLGQFTPLVSGRDMAAINESQAKSAALSAESERQNREQQYKMQQDFRKQQQESALSELSKIAYDSHDPRSAEALRALHAADPVRGEKAMQYHEAKGKHVGTWATILDQTPEKDMPKAYEHFTNYVNSGTDPFINSKDLKAAGLSDKYDRSKRPIISNIAQMWRDLEDSRKAPKEAADLEATRASTAKTYADIEKTKLETQNLKSGGSGEKPPQGYRFTKNGELEAIPGGPALKLTPEQAGKVALINQGALDVKRFSNSIMDKDGSYNRTKLAALFTPGSVGARKEYSTLFNAVNARLRLESGTAVPPAEVKAAIKTFAPGSTDSDETIRSKIERMGEFFQLAQDQIGQGRGDMIAPPAATQYKEGQTATNPKTGETLTFTGGKWQ